MLNCYQFSAAKDMTETKALQELAIKAKGFEDFRKQAYEEVTSINRDVWLRVEMDSCIRGAVMGESWRSLEQSKDVYPYWQYKTEEDDRVREEHEALDNLVFKIGDPDGDDVYPPCDWDCRCHSEPLDDSDLTEQDLEVSEGKDYLTEKDENGKDYVDPDFRFNPGKQGPMTNDSDYFHVLPSANKSDYELFDFE